MKTWIGYSILFFTILLIFTPSILDEVYCYAVLQSPVHTADPIPPFIETREVEKTVYIMKRLKVPNEFEVTFYCDRGTTRSGLPTRTGSLAVDPQIVPIGTRVRFQGFPVSVPRWTMADDTGRLVKGAVMDVFLWSGPLCKKYGRIKAKTTIQQDSLGDYILVEAAR